jgi:diaminopimelate decarboxylase
MPKPHYTFDKQLVEKLSHISTPFYFYDMALLRNTVSAIQQSAAKHDYHIHYAMKANTNTQVLQAMVNIGFGADCVSGGEVEKALATNFKPSQIVFAGVGKSDAEILIGLRNNIFCFNCESIQELEVINQLAANENKIASVTLRINPNVNAGTHHYITTGLEENKFGINEWELDAVTEKLKSLSNVTLTGIHFHVGSQILDLNVFAELCNRVNHFQNYFFNKKITLQTINVGGGLGVNYTQPNEAAVNDFETYFALFNRHLVLKPNQQVHFELGRSIVAQCGNLISRVLYIKNGVKTNFAILDAGMTELIRPALYQAFHHIENISADYLQSEKKKF